MTIFLPNFFQPRNFSEPIRRLRNSLSAHAESFGIDYDRLNLRYVTGLDRALVFDVTLRNGTNSNRLFAKVGVDLSTEVQDFIRQEAANTKAIFDSFPSSNLISVVEPLFYCPDNAVFATKPIPGIRLDKALIQAVRNPTADRIRHAENLLGTTAKWLRAFQGLENCYGRLSMDELYAGAQRQLDRLANANLSSIPPTMIELIAANIRKLLGQLDASAYQITLRHDDFAPWNILCNGEQVFVFDFANVQYGSQYYDRYYFDQALANYAEKPFVRKRSITHLRQYFSAEFSQDCEPTRSTHDFFALYFSLVRLGSLVKWHGPDQSVTIVNQFRVAKERRRILELCQRDI